MKTKICCSYLTVALSYVIFVTFWLAHVFGYIFYLFFDDESNSKCYAPQDSSVTVPLGSDAPSIPDNYHDVSANFDVCLYWGLINYTLIVGSFFIVRQTGVKRSCEALFALYIITMLFSVGA